MRAICVALIAALVMQPIAAQAEQRAARIAVTPQSEKGLLVLRTDELPVASGVRSAFHLYLGAYDPIQETISENFFDSRVRFEAQPRYFADGYLVMDIDPGTYVFKAFVRQDLWLNCYNAETVQFTVQAGQALYLGHFNAILAMAYLQTRATLSNQLQSIGGQIVFYDIPGPQITDLDEAGLAAAQAMASSNLPLTTSRLSLAELSPARFSTGRTAERPIRSCGSRTPEAAIDR